MRSDFDPENYQHTFGGISEGGWMGQQLAGRLGLKGQLIVGMMNGYGRVADKPSGEAYCRERLEGSRKNRLLEEWA